MRKEYLLLFGTMFAVLLAGCEGDGRRAYMRHICWEQALVEDTTPDASYSMYRVQKGHGVILEITEGYSRSWRTTAHSSHDTVYLKIDSMPVPGNVLMFDTIGENILYEGFSGYDFHVAISSKPTIAEVHVLSVDRRKITADVKIDIPWRFDSMSTNTNNLSFDKRIHFIRKRK